MRRRTIGFELENLHDCAAGERVDNSSSGGLNNNRCLTHPLPRETLDLFPKLVTGNSKQSSLRPLVGDHAPPPRPGAAMRDRPGENAHPARKKIAKDAGKAA